MADVTSSLFISIHLSQEKPFENGLIWLLELSFMSLFSGALFEFNQTKITVDEGYDATLIFYVFKYRDIDLGAETWDQALFSFRRARRNEKRGPILAAAVRENVWEPLKLSLISGYFDTNLSSETAQQFQMLKVIVSAWTNFWRQCAPLYRLTTKNYLYLDWINL